MKKLYIILASIWLTACIEEPAAIDESQINQSLDDISFQAFDFATSKTINLEISDFSAGAARFEVAYQWGGRAIHLGAYSKQNSSIATQLTVPTWVEELSIIKNDGQNSVSYNAPIVGNQSTLSIDSESAGSAFTSNSFESENSCVDRLYAVNNNGQFFTIDLTNSAFDRTDLPNLQGGGSIANALDQANGIMYYNVGKTLYAYDIATNSFTVKHTSNPFNGSYPRLEYKDGFFYMANGSTMYKVNAETNTVITQYNVTGFINNNSGGDLAFDSQGDLYLACFSGLYKFISLDDANGTATITRISAENFPFQLTSMAIDRQDRIFVGTNDSNSNLIQISKEDGAYTIVKTFDRKINDLTAWKCEATELDQQDSDNDGIIDELDDYPNDPDAATDVFTPSELGMGTFAFEDLWPQKGDYDFNDMVMGYRYTNVLNSANQLVRLKINLTVRAVGASKHSGFGIVLDVDPALIASVSGHSTLGNNTSLDAKGLEANQDKAVIIAFNDIFNHMQPAGGALFINTDPSENTTDVYEQEIMVEFTNPIDPALLGAAPFNPFIFSSLDRSQEVHLSGHMPTALADLSTFGTESDDSHIAAGKTYQDANNLPWAIHVIHQFRYPIEKARIHQGYNRFVQWGQSRGTLYPDWYGDNSGYRNTSKLYFRN